MARDPVRELRELPTLRADERALHQALLPYLRPDGATHASAEDGDISRLATLRRFSAPATPQRWRNIRRSSSARAPGWHGGFAVVVATAVAVMAGVFAMVGERGQELGQSRPGIAEEGAGGADWIYVPRGDVAAILPSGQRISFSKSELGAQHLKVGTRLAAGGMGGGELERAGTTVTLGVYAQVEIGERGTMTLARGKLNAKAGPGSDGFVSIRVVEHTVTVVSGWVGVLKASDESVSVMAHETATLLIRGEEVAMAAGQGLRLTHDAPPSSFGVSPLELRWQQVSPVRPYAPKVGLRGHVPPGSLLVIQGKPVSVRPNGSFDVSISKPTTPRVRASLHDGAGETKHFELSLQILEARWQWQGNSDGESP